MRRQRKDFSIFNMSMLDVICSALGAFLILFLVLMQRQNQAIKDAVHRGGTDRDHCPRSIDP